MEDIISDAVKSLLADHCTPAVVRAIEAGESRVALWDQVEGSGFLDALLPESVGGAGLALADVYPVLELCGTFAVPVPLGETMLGRGLLARADMPAPAGTLVLGAGRLASDGRLSCSQVHCGTQADWVLMSCGDACRLLPAADAQIQVANFCLDAQMSWSQTAWDHAKQLPGSYDLVTLQAALYAAQLAGALMAVCSRSLQYANNRHQFGKPIGKFQAIQHQLSLMSEHAFAARMAAQLGFCVEGQALDRLRVAMAKARTSEAALEVAGLSHSIHGAIGFTREFDLQLYTRRLHAWRQAAGSESYWHDIVGQALLDSSEPMSLNMMRTLTDIHV
jgi:acyl-CoA dehydrogenase